MVGLGGAIKKDIMPTIDAGIWKQHILILEKSSMETVKIKQATKQGYAEMELGGVCDLNYVSSKTRRGRVQGKGQISPTVCAENPSIFRITKGENEEMANAEDYRIRKLTARECGRLMNVPEDAIDRMHTIESESQRYKAYGNSIVVNCLVGIFGMMLPGKENEYKKI